MKRHRNSSTVAVEGAELDMSTANRLGRITRADNWNVNIQSDLYKPSKGIHAPCTADVLVMGQGCCV